MLVQVFTTAGEQFVDHTTLPATDDMRLRCEAQLRAQELLSTSPSMMSMLQLQELVRILCDWTGLSTPPTP